MLSDSKALELVQRLAAIPGFPEWSGPVCGEVAAALNQMCRTEEEAERVVSEAVATFSRWEGAGIPALRKIRDNERGDIWEPDWDTQRLYSGYKAECTRCNDTGVVTESLLAEEIEVCDCGRADYEYAAKLNRTKAAALELRELADRHRPTDRLRALTTALRVGQALKDIGA